MSTQDKYRKQGKHKSSISIFLLKIQLIQPNRKQEAKSTTTSPVKTLVQKAYFTLNYSWIQNSPIFTKVIWISLKPLDYILPTTAQTYSDEKKGTEALQDMQIMPASNLNECVYSLKKNLHTIWTFALDCQRLCFPESL